MWGIGRNLGFLWEKSKNFGFEERENEFTLFLLETLEICERNLGVS